MKVRIKREEIEKLVNVTYWPHQLSQMMGWENEGVKLIDPKVLPDFVELEGEQVINTNL